MATKWRPRKIKILSGRSEVSQILGQRNTCATIHFVPSASFPTHVNVPGARPKNRDEETWSCCCAECCGEDFLEEVFV